MFEPPEPILEDLLALSRALGQPGRNLVILAEGNTSARQDEDSFYVKASGASLDGIRPEDFVAVRFGPLMDAIKDDRALDDGDVAALLTKATIGSPGSPQPSLESFVHAAALLAGGAAFVAHSHPSAVNGILCSSRAAEIMRGPLFPDEAVVCGARYVLIPYRDPGLDLGREVYRALLQHRQEHSAMPKALMLLNHGLVALGRTAAEALAVTEMATKAATIRLTSLLLGGANPLESTAIERLDERLDEKGRVDRIAGRG